MRAKSPTEKGIQNIIELKEKGSKSKIKNPTGYSNTQKREIGSWSLNRNWIGVFELELYSFN